MIGRTVMCNDCGMYHESVTVCPYRFVPSTGQVLSAPLPPTAEQTSIARFNALANEMRTNHEFIVGVMGSFENRIMEQHNWLTGFLFGWQKRLDEQTAELNAKLDAHAQFWETLNDNMEEIVYRLKLRDSSKRAAAKKKAAPLVGKKGTGRKG